MAAAIKAAIASSGWGSDTAVGVAHAAHIDIEAKAQSLLQLFLSTIAEQVAAPQPAAFSTAVAVLDALTLPEKRDSGAAAGPAGPSLAAFALAKDFVPHLLTVFKDDIKRLVACLIIAREMRLVDGAACVTRGIWDLLATSLSSSSESYRGSRELMSALYAWVKHVLDSKLPGELVSSGLLINGLLPLVRSIHHDAATTVPACRTVGCLLPLLDNGCKQAAADALACGVRVWCSATASGAWMPEACIEAAVACAEQLSAVARLPAARWGNGIAGSIAAPALIAGLRSVIGDVEPGSGPGSALWRADKPAAAGSGAFHKLPPAASALSDRLVRCMASLDSDVMAAADPARADAGRALAQLVCCANPDAALRAAALLSAWQLAGLLLAEPALAAAVQCRLISFLDEPLCTAADVGHIASVIGAMLRHSPAARAQIAAAPAGAVSLDASASPPPAPALRLLSAIAAHTDVQYIACLVEDPDPHFDARGEYGHLGMRMVYGGEWPEYDDTFEYPQRVSRNAFDLIDAAASAALSLSLAARKAGDYHHDGTPVSAFSSGGEQRNAALRCLFAAQRGPMLQPSQNPSNRQRANLLAAVTVLWDALFAEEPALLARHLDWDELRDMMLALIEAIELGGRMLASEEEHGDDWLSSGDG